MRRRWRDSHLLVGADGSVYSEVSHKMVGFVAYSGYRCVARDKKIHQIVMELYGPPCPDPSYVIDHINGDKTDNRVENLQWVSQRDNVRKGRRVVLSAELVRELRETYQRGGVTVRELAELHGVKLKTLQGAFSGRYWELG